MAPRPRKAKPDPPRTVSSTDSTSDKILVLSNEKQEDYDALRAAFLKRFAPKDEVELELVDEMVGAKWRLRRIRSMESDLMDMRMEEHDEFLKERRENPSARRRQTMAFKSLADTSQSLTMLTRYETRLQRTYERAFDNLKKLRAFPYPEEAPEQAPTEEPTPSPLIEMKPLLVFGGTNRSEPAADTEAPAPDGCIMAPECDSD